MFWVQRCEKKKEIDEEEKIEVSAKEGAIEVLKGASGSISAVKTRTIIPVADASSEAFTGTLLRWASCSGLRLGFQPFLRIMYSFKK